MKLKLLYMQVFAGIILASCSKNDDKIFIYQAEICDRQTEVCIPNLLIKVQNDKMQATTNSEGVFHFTSTHPAIKIEIIDQDGDANGAYANYIVELNPNDKRLLITQKKQL